MIHVNNTVHMNYQSSVIKILIIKSKFLSKDQQFH